MGTPRWKVSPVTVLLCTVIACNCALTKVDQTIHKSHHNHEISIPLEASVQKKSHIQGENKNDETSIENVGFQETNDIDMAPERKMLFKREAMKPKNTKRRKKFSKKKMQSNKSSDSESKTESKSSDSSETSSESETSSDDSSKSKSSRKKSKSKSRNKKSKSESSESDESSKSSYSDNSSEMTSSHTESTEEIYSGPDSSSRHSSDSTDESSASRAISGDSSEVSYTLGSSGSVYSSSSETQSEYDESETDASEKGKTDSSKVDSSVEGKSNSTSKSIHDPKVTIKNRKDKVSEIHIELIKNKKAMKAKKHRKNKHKKFEDKLSKPVKQKFENKKHYPQHLDVTTERVLKMAEKASIQTHDNSITKENKKSLSKIDSSITVHGVEATKERPKLEMLKVKKAEIDPKKKADLEQELIKDYPVDGTVEILNWQGTFAPIIGEPYVAPVHHQVHENAAPILQQKSGALLAKNKDKGRKDQKKKPKLTPKEKKKKKREDKNNANDLDKPSPKKVKTAGMSKGSPKNNAELHVQNNPSPVAMHNNAELHVQHNPSPVAMHNNAALHVQHIPSPVAMHAAGKSEENLKEPNEVDYDSVVARKSEENLKTPSEEERESGTTYKPEGAYEYPSFRHPDFNPDTAYDENGIPIHESPGWTHPPTLPGDRRFGKERSRAAAGINNQAHATLAKPQVSQNKRTILKNPQDLHANLAAQEHQHVAESLKTIHADHMNLQHIQHSLHENMAPHEIHKNPQDLHANLAAQEHQHAADSLKTIHSDHMVNTINGLNHDTVHLIDPHAGHDDHNEIPFVLPAHQQGVPIKDNVVKHRIQKREASSPASTESLESMSSVMSTKELDAAAKEHEKQEAAKGYKAYQLTDSEMKNKEGGAPLEALNPDLYMHRNMIQVKKKPKENFLPKMGPSEEVIAVIVNPQNGIPIPNIPKMRLHKIEMRKPILEEPVVYNKQNEALNPLLYKNRNMFRAGDWKSTMLKMNNDMRKQMNMERAHSENMKKAALIGEYFKSTHALKGKGRENFNPLFINKNKMFHVRTNKFKPASMEHYIVKREAEESLNPLLYSYKNLFSANPKQILPLQNNPVMEKKHSFNPEKISRTWPIGRGKENINPYLYQYPNMFSADGPKGHNKLFANDLPRTNNNREGSKPYSSVEKQAVLSKYKNLFANDSPRTNNNMKRSKIPVYKPPNMFDRHQLQKREIKEKHTKEAARPQPTFEC